MVSNVEGVAGGDVRDAPRISDMLSAFDLSETSLGPRSDWPASLRTAVVIMMASGHAMFDLIFTDVVLPGSLTGCGIALHARTARPNTPVLFTSGYARETIVQNERLEGGVELLSKPFTYSDLASKVRKAIESRPLVKVRANLTYQ